MGGDPIMYIRAVDSARCTHVGDNTEEFAGLELAETFRAGITTHDGIAASFKHRADIAHHCRLIFDKQDGQTGRLRGRRAHGFTTPATADKDANSLIHGSRTVHVAAGSAPLLAQRISPPCP